jgi:peptidylprolyl isomerase
MSVVAWIHYMMWISVGCALMMRLLLVWQLAFPKGLSAAAGRPRVAPSTPVIFDVQLLYIPGVSDFDE